MPQALDALVEDSAAKLQVLIILVSWWKHWHFVNESL